MDVGEGLAAFAVLAWLAYLVSRVLARRQIPELVAFLVVGAVAGPSGLGLLGTAGLQRLAPITEIALGVLMFVIGERLSVRALRRIPWVPTAGVAQATLAGVAVLLVGRWLGGDRSTVLLLATMAGAGAPLTVASVVTSVRARSRYAEGLVGVHALSDALAALAFAAVLPIAILLAESGQGLGDATLRFLRLGAGGLVLGVVLGWLVGRLGQQIETTGELLLFVAVHLLAAWAVADALELSLPLAALVAGAYVASATPHDFSQRCFRVVRSVEQPLYLLFFALAGAAIHLGDLPRLGALGLAYVVARPVGKLVGSLVGGPLGGLSARESLRLGFHSVPQAGVAVGLAVLAGEALPAQGGDAGAVVLGAVVLFELLGPLIVARGLRRGAAEAPLEVPEPGDLPAVVVLASPLRVDLPGWVVDVCHRWQSRLVTLTRRPDDDPAMARLRERARVDGIDLEVHALTGESFTGAVTALAEGVGADLVVVLAPVLPSRRLESRLVLAPHERIARRLRCPVVGVPFEVPAASRRSPPAEAGS